VKGMKNLEESHFKKTHTHTTSRKGALSLQIANCKSACVTHHVYPCTTIGHSHFTHECNVLLYLKVERLDLNNKIQRY
jgi:hypothetical protein